MNPPNMSILTPGEEEFFAQEKGITDAVIQVIAVAKKENAMIKDDNVQQSVVDVCKNAVMKTRHFQGLIQMVINKSVNIRCFSPKDARRPYITHAVELLGALVDVNVAITGIEDVLAAARAEFDAETAEMMQKELKTKRLQASELIADFKRWLYTSDASYMFATDRTLDMPQPASPDVAKTDMLRCPRWLITHLVQARRAELASENQWRALSDELNQTKLKLTQATGLDELKAKDAIIKKLNASLQLMHRDTETKSRELEDIRGKALSLAQQLRAARDNSPASLGKDSKKNNDPPTPSHDSAEVLLLRTEVNRLKAQLAQANLKLHIGSTAPPLLRAVNPNSSSALTAGAGSTDQMDFDDELLPPPPPPAAEAAPFNLARHWMTPEGKRVAMCTLLTDPSMAFVDCLGRSIVAGTDADSCAVNLIQLYSSQNTLMTVLEHLIATEVSRCKSVNTLFRGEELSSRVLRSFVRLNGLDYCATVLGPLITEVAVNNYNFEVDPNRANSTMNLKENFTKLENLTQRFLDAILDSYSLVPPEFLRLCKCIHDHSAVKFANEDYEQLVVAGFMFLRFICPCIAAPESFKLQPIETAESRRTLLLVGKLLQNLANGTEFKEDFLQDMNAFLKKNARSVANFFQKLRTYPVEIDGNAPFLIEVARSVYNRKDKIKSNLPQMDLDSQTWSCVVTTPLKDRLKLSINAVSSIAPTQLTSHPDIVSAFASMFVDNSDLVPQLLTLLSKQTDLTVRKTVADSLVPLAYSTGRFEDFVRTLVQNEVAASAYEYANQSVTKHVFSLLGVLYCNDWLCEVLTSYVNPIVTQNVYLESDPSKVTDPALKASLNISENIGKLRSDANSVLSMITNSLDKAPKPLWMFSNAITLNTMQNLCQFFLLHIVVPALESPHLYRISERPKKEAGRTLSIIADMIRNYANGSNVLIDNIPMGQAVWSEKYYEVFNTWAKFPPQTLRPAAEPASQEDLAMAAVNLSAWLSSQMLNLNNLVGEFQNTHSVDFSIVDLMDNLPVPAEKPAAINLTAAASPAGSRSSLGSAIASLDPKDKKRLKEEEEKRKKEEEKRKKEEEKRKKEEEKEEEKRKKEEEKRKKEEEKNKPKPGSGRITLQ